MIKKALRIGLTLSMLGFVSAAVVRADQADTRDRKTVLTFSQPVEIPGQVLAAGTYTFKLANSMTDRNIVEVFNKDGSQLIATVLTIPDYRLKATDETVIRFTEMPAGSPEAIRAWFYPGNTLGQEFVYPKARATALAKASKHAVPAMASDGKDANELKTARIVAITPDENEANVGEAIQTTPVGAVGNATMSARATDTAPATRKLPKTASTLPLIVLFGLGCLAIASSAMIFSRRPKTAAIL